MAAAATDNGALAFPRILWGDVMDFLRIHERNMAVHEAIEAVCPIHGISFAADDPAAWKIQPKEEATREQIDAANALLASFDNAKVIEKAAKKNRRDVVRNIDRAVLKLLREMHKRLAAIERSQQSFAEWRDDVLTKFVNDGD